LAPSRAVATTRIAVTGSSAISEVLIDLHQGLVQGQVRRLAVGGPGPAEQACGVLPYLVEDHHGVVQRVAEDGQQADDGRGADLETG